jgi:Protein of unknown function (DUF3618)
MGQDPSAGRTTVSEPRDPEQLRAEIETTREELGDTVEALAEKTDVKAQTKRKAEETKASVAGKKDELLGQVRQTSPDAAVSAAGELSQKARQNPIPLAAGSAFIVGFLAGRISSR